MNVNPFYLALEPFSLRIFAKNHLMGGFYLDRITHRYTTHLRYPDPDGHVDSINVNQIKKNNCLLQSSVFCLFLCKNYPNWSWC